MSPTHTGASLSSVSKGAGRREISQQMATGAAWMVAARFSDRFIGLASTVVLARLLVPDDFGLVVMATVIIAAVQLLGAFNFDLALIQHPNTERWHYDTVWTANLLFAAFFAVVLVGLASPAARFYAEPRLAPVMYALACGTLLGGFTNVGVVEFRKQMQFHKEFNLVLAKKAGSAMVTISLAILWRNYWALVIGVLTATCIELALSYLMHPFRPRLSLAARKELFGFSQWLFINNLLMFLYHRASDFIIAKGAGPTAVGYYSVAYEVSNLPSTELVAPVNRAAFPGYAKIAANVAAARSGFINVLSLLCLLIIPAAVGLACIAEPVVALVLGPKWLAAVPLIEILAINGLFMAILSCSSYVYLALGKPRQVTFLIAAHLAIALPLMAWSMLHRDVEAIAWSLLAASVITVPLNYFLLRKALAVNALDLARVLWRPVLGAVVMAVGIKWTGMAQLFPGSSMGGIGALLLAVGFGAVTYCITVTVLWWLCSQPPGAEIFVRERARHLADLFGRRFALKRL